MPSTSARSDVTGSPPGLPAIWYDGRNALRHEGHAHWPAEDELVLADAAGQTLRIPVADLRFGELLPAERLYRRASSPDFQLRLPRDLPDDLARRLPAASEYGSWIDRIGLGRAVAAFGIASAATIALFMTAPEWLGPMVPPGWERQLGETMVGDLGNRLCSTPEGDAALAKLLDAVDPAREQVRVGVANLGIVNAAALPGGQVLLFDGLIRQAESPEEVAGVLAHEVGHVRERHVMTAILRQFGLSVLLAGASSGLGETAFGLASLGYSREAEREADAFARRRMAQGNVSPLGAARFFERMAERYEGHDGQAAVIGWIASHPSSTERARAYRADARKGADYPPVLTAEEFAALQAICSDDPDVGAFDLF